MGKYDSLFDATPTVTQAAPAPVGKYGALFDEAPPERSSMAGNIASAALKGVAWVGEQYDRFLSAPTRAAVDAMQNVQLENMTPEERARLQSAPLPDKLLNTMVPPVVTGTGLRAWGAGISAGLGQFGRDPDKVPTGQQLAQKAGVENTAVSDVLPSLYSETGEGLALKRGGFLDPTKSGMVGLGLDIGLDPSNVVPVGPAAKGAAMVAGRGVKGAAKATATGVDLLTGTEAATRSLEGLGRASDAVGSALSARFGTKPAKDFEKSLATASANGIDPELLPASVKHGPSSAASRQERVIAEGPLGQPLLERHEAGRQAVRDALEKDIENIATKPGGKALEAPVTIPATAADAGDLIKSSYDKRVDEILGDMAQTYRSFTSPNLENSAAKFAGGSAAMEIPAPVRAKLNSRLAEAEAYARDLAENSFDDVSEAQGKQLLKAVERIRNGTGNYDQLVTGMQGIGRTAFKVKNTMAAIPPDVAKFRKIYGDLSEAAIETVETNIGKDAANALRQNNKAISELFGDKSILAQLGDNTKDPEKLFQSLILNGGSKRIEALKKYLSPEEMQALKGAFLKESVRLAQGEVGFRGTLNMLHQKRNVVDALFTTGELDNFKNLLELGDKFGPAVMSTSGTGASNQWSRFLSLRAPLEAVELGADAVAAGKQSKAVNQMLPSLGDGNPSLKARLMKVRKQTPGGKAARVYSIQDDDEKE